MEYLPEIEQFVVLNLKKKVKGSITLYTTPKSHAYKKV